MTRITSLARLLAVLLLTATFVMTGAGRLHAQETPTVEPTAEPTEEVEETATTEPTATTAPDDDDAGDDEGTDDEGDVTVTPAAGTGTVAPTAPAGGAATTATTTTAAQGRPVHVHEGSCDALGEVVAPLTDLLGAGGSTDDGDGGLDDTGDADDLTDAGGPIPAEVSFTTIPLSLDELLTGGYAINAHLSYDEIDTYVACGEIGGTALASGAVAIGLRELEGSDFAGIAYLAPNAADPSQTDVSVFLAEDLSDDGFEVVDGDDSDAKADDENDGLGDDQVDDSQQDDDEDDSV